MELTETVNEETFVNQELKKMVSPDNDLKNFLVEYTGEFLNLQEGAEVTVEHLVEVVGREFPEFLLAVAEENWVRGYQQALQDADEGEKIYQKMLDGNHDEYQNKKVIPLRDLFISIKLITGILNRSASFINLIHFL